MSIQVESGLFFKKDWNYLKFTKGHTHREIAFGSFSGRDTGAIQAYPWFWTIKRPKEIKRRTLEGKKSQEPRVGTPFRFFISFMFRGYARRFSAFFNGTEVIYFKSDFPGHTHRSRALTAYQAINLFFNLRHVLFFPSLNCRWPGLSKAPEPSSVTIRHPSSKSELFLMTRCCHKDRRLIPTHQSLQAIGIKEYFRLRPNSIGRHSRRIPQLTFSLTCLYKFVKSFYIYPK